jgi:adenine-specific DNA-methyltransferase
MLAQAWVPSPALSLTGGFGFKAVELTAYSKVKAKIIAGDYIELATAGDLHGEDYTHAILNPFYKKINSNSAHRLALRSVGIETVKMYSAFVALAVAQAAPGSQIVAIILRSFCNGFYYRLFRDFILSRAAIRHLHVFESRNKVFKDDDMLQENVIMPL